MRIQAFRRKETITVDTGNTLIEFGVNDKGDVVADVADEADVEILLNISEAYRPYEAVRAATAKASKSSNAPTAEDIEQAREKPEADAAAAEAARQAAEDATSKFVLKNGDDTLDLGKMDDDELKAFAKEQGVTVHHTQKGDKLRQKIIDALTAE